MEYTARYKRRDGAGVSRHVDKSEAIDILSNGRYSALETRVTDDHGNLYGVRGRAVDFGLTDLRKDSWVWFWDDEGCLSSDYLYNKSTPDEKLATPCQEG